MTISPNYPARLAHLRAINDNPDDDNARLQYSDLLAKDGQPTAAALIRVQVEQARTPPGRRAEALARQADGLAGDLARDVGSDGWPEDLRVRLARGLIDMVVVAGEHVCGPVASLIRAGLVRTLFVGAEDDPTVLQPAAACSDLAGIDNLRLWVDVSGPSVQAFVRSPHLGGLRTLFVTAQEPMTGDFLRALADGPGLTQLRALELLDPRLEYGDLRVLGRSALFRRLTRLRVRRPVPSHADLAELLDGSGTAPATLELDGLRLDARTVAGFFRQSGLADVRRLELRRAGLGDAAAGDVAACPHLADLERLDLSQNRIGPAGAAALLESPHLARTRIALGRNRIPPRDWQRLCRRYGDRLVDHFTTTG